MRLIEILESICKDQLHLALVQCWEYFRSNDPAFQKAEQDALNNEPEHVKHREELLERLSESTLRDASYVDELLAGFPLAVMEALDQYLFERHHAKGPPFLQPMLAGNSTCYLWRRTATKREQPRHDYQTGHLQSWIRHHLIVPTEISGYKISILPLANRFAFSRQIMGGGQIKVHISSFPDGVTPHWKEPSPNAVTAEILTDTEKRWKSIASALRAAVKQKAHIVVFPELTLCPDLRRKVSDWLRRKESHPFLLVLPGSFHQELSDGVFNYAELLNHTGKVVLTHRKLIPFGEKHASGPQKKREAIRTGDRIDFLDTPLGLISIPICRDFCEEGLPFRHLWEEIGAEWLLVPAFGGKKSLSAHKDRADSLLRSHGTVCALANQDPRGGPCHYGFISHPGTMDSGHSTDKPCQDCCTPVRI